MNLEEIKEWLDDNDISNDELYTIMSEGAYWSEDMGEEIKLPFSVETVYEGRNYLEPSEYQIVARLDGELYGLSGYYDSWSGMDFSDGKLQEVRAKKIELIVYE